MKSRKSNVIKVKCHQVLNLCVIPNVRYSSRCFNQICKAQYGAAILVYHFGTTIWRPERSVNVWNLLSF